MRRSRLASGAWVRLLDSQVFALASHPGTWKRQCMAATLSVPGGALSGPAAAALHEFPGWKPGRIEVCTRHGTTHRSPFGDVRETRTVGRFVVVGGIRVVSPADCIVQVAPGRGRDGARDLIDEARKGRPHLLAELRDRHVALLHSRLPHMTDLGQALEWFGDGKAVARTALERQLADVFERIDVPSVVYEAAAPWLEGGEHRIDALIPEWKLIVEADGRAWHTRVADFERDRWRDACALAAGYATLRLTWHQLTRRRTWCRNIVVAIGHRSGQPACLTTT